MIVCSAADEPTTPVADVILPHRLIGNEAAAHSREYLRERNVAAIVNVTPTENPHRRILERKGVTLLQIPVLDTSTAELYASFEAAIAFIRQQRSNERCVLVHCHQGTSRSATIVVAYLMHTFRWPLRQALNFVLDHRPPESPLTHPNSNFLMQLVRLEARLLSPSAPSLEFFEYTREAHTVWNGRNRGPCVVEACCCRTGSG
jgi:protein-tyrosine phosphatase